MKKTNFLALLMAIALASTFSLSACSSSDEVTSDNAEPNPTYDGTSVRTDFAFNITKASQTRMSAVNTQNNNNFLGMTDMYLLPFNEVPAANKTTNYASGNVKNYYLGSLTASNVSSTQSSKVYSLTFPVGTNNFLFYGRADNSGVSENFKKGKIEHTLTNAVDNTNSINFKLTSLANVLGNDSSKIVTYLTAIANAKYSDTSTSPATEKTWAGTVTTAQTDGTYSAIALLYSKFINNITQYSGSKESVERLVFDLYKSAYAINAQSSVTGVKNIAEAVCTAIENTSGTVKLEVKASKVDNAATISISTTTDVSKADEWFATLSGVTQNFPANLFLPMGAAQLKWDDTNKKFAYKGATDNETGLGPVTTGTTALITDYRYPAELIYFDNSPLRATNQYKKVGDYPATVAKWDELYQAETWPQKAVAADTRAVAMTNNVNYGVALLETTVKLNSTSLTDNMKNIIGGSASNQNITAVTSNKNVAEKKSVFKVTGILVGGQPAKVGWNMIPASGEDFKSVIYDHDVTFKETALSTSATGQNYTVVFDNYNSSEQKDVLIALEIVNDGCDFYGAEGLIPAGNTFYLVGKLELNGSTGVTDKTIPEIRSGVKRNATNSTYRITQEGTKRVFVQDYKTVVNLTLKSDALQKAYSAIPDLRATEVLFGLSVDLNWEHGMTFDVDM